MNTSKRLEKLRQKLSCEDVDAIFVSHPENWRYLSGFDGSSGFLLITQKEAVLATDFRYIEQSRQQAPDCRIFQIQGNLLNWFPELLAGLSIKRLGLESENISLTTYQQICKVLKKLQPEIEPVPIAGLVESLRAVKESEELELISRAAAIADNALEYIAGVIHTGMTEAEAAWELEKRLRENGSQPLPFEVIVASGPNSSLPHAKPSQRSLQEGEPIIIDIGARVEGYCSDITRTICLGRASEEFQKIYGSVLDAQKAAVAIIKKGTTGDQADSAARKAIEQAGHGEAFGHALGHGVGLAAHEAPRLGPGSTDVLSSSMVFTIEPGIYLPGWGGVRIEDLVLLGKEKVQIISKARKV